MPTVLVVDDSGDLRESLGELLTYEGFSVRRAASGEQALDQLRASRELPDVMLLDLVMPGLSGADVLAALRGTSAAAVPVVIMTGYDELVVQPKLGVPVVSKTDFGSLLAALRLSCRAPRARSFRPDFSA
jgi:CheY-like chemotaxis protein